MTYAIVEGINSNTNGIHGFRVGYVKTQEIIGDHEIVDGNLYCDRSYLTLMEKKHTNFLLFTVLGKSQFWKQKALIPCNQTT